MLNTDGAVKTTLGLGGRGGVIQNHRGDWIIGFISREAHINPILVEIRALRQGFLMSMEFKTHPLDINTDSMIHLLEHESHPYTNLISECRSLIEKLGTTMPTHIFREQNKVSDMLSKECLKCNIFGKLTYLIVSPLFAKDATWTEISGTMYSRKLYPNIISVIVHTTTKNSNYATTSSIFASN
ncbi:hypothetical protein R3W88_001152 [Solanum pinnatisectum]|uniref:RNase H type-1 domain-containing protein n=1 Tax=Solanum pinnatisectum TaxID=50273 RepID=A0AAV9MHF6_9SOLN|nr:hypothetical protein R3W88_001152 [Solanum pinnatisectum]